jgi:dinuclear metal center YbgI/SA1388 family protein
MAAVSVPLWDLVQYLDRFLAVADVPDEPNAVNGLQVENGGTVDWIAAAVDASLATIEGVLSDRPPGRGLLLVHHGLFWDGNVPVTGRRYRRIGALFRADLAVYSAHIPLDVHPEVGNNAVLARLLGLTNLEPFDTYRGVSIGWQGTIASSESREQLVVRLESLLGAAGRLIPGGPPDPRRVGIITGAAGNRIAAAHRAGLDTFITGEGPHHTYFDAMELGVNVIYAGHYATEKVGVKALAAHLSNHYGLPWRFHDYPTGL